MGDEIEEAVDDIVEQIEHEANSLGIEVDELIDRIQREIKARDDALSSDD